MKEFEGVAAVQGNAKWENIIKREVPLYQRTNDIRSPFERDYTRIIHSTAYRRLKHKTQVFFSPENDHICTRSEHVTHVESISYTIAHHLGLNTELTRAIATAHDIGHSPFGHQGEKILSKISERDVGEKFWHERNGMIMVDKVELLENPDGDKFNLDLTDLANRVVANDLGGEQTLDVYEMIAYFLRNLAISNTEIGFMINSGFFTSVWYNFDDMLAYVDGLDEGTQLR